MIGGGQVLQGQSRYGGGHGVCERCSTIYVVWVPTPPSHDTPRLTVILTVRFLETAGRLRGGVKIEEGRVIPQIRILGIEMSW